MTGHAATLHTTTVNMAVPLRTAMRKAAAGHMAAVHTEEMKATAVTKLCLRT